MNILSFRKNNIIVFPKCGSTTVIKICTDIKEFEHHRHSYTHNNCKLHKKIHNCGRTVFNKNYQTTVIFRYPHERLMSFYISNNYVMNKKWSFRDFINIAFKNPNDVKGFIHHCSSIYTLLDKENLLNIKKIFVHLKKLNDFWLKTFNIDISKHHIINKTNSDKMKIDDDLLNKIKNYYENDYLIESNFLT